MNAPLGHGVILASAGAGKTYRLANRIIRLLADGAAPGEIVALTFTRKAAAEFVSRVLTNLARASSDDAEARRLALAIGKPGTTREDFRTILGATIAAAHRLRFGTLDAFFQSLVRTHPLELGLAGGFALLDERRAARERKKILRSLLRAADGEPETVRSFLEAFRLASYGKESRGASGLLAEFAGEARALYRENEDAGIWGGADAVWPAGTPWLPPPDADTLRRAGETLALAMEGAKFGHATFDRSLATFVAKAVARTPGTPVDELGAFFKDRILPVATLVRLLRGETWTLEFSKKTIEVPPAITGPLGVLVRGILGDELESRLHRTAGAGKMVEQYDALYTRAVIDAGLLSFDDILHALAAPKHAEALARAAYRLDGRVKHWLFDEFQDTARDAWRVLAMNAGEAIADTSGERSVFFVGDVKQALYGWNGGDHRLLPELVGTHALPTEDLYATQRCGPDVLALTNAVCGGLAATPGIPGKAAADWTAAWHDHVCGERAKANAGYAAWVVVPKPKRDEGDADEAKLAVVTERLKAGRLLERGLACGILTANNREASLAAEYLREAGVPAVSETDVAPAEDNPVTLALLALIRHAAHPGDSLAAETVAMTPLGKTAGSVRARERVLATFASEGAEAALREILTDAAGVMPSDEFSLKRVRDLLDIAREYDLSGERDADAFLEFAAGSKRRDTAAARRVQVMTVHKSKGLEFDCVFLPFLDGDPVDALRQEGFIALRDAPDAPPRAVLAPPPAAICETDPVLRASLDERRAEAAYEKFCLLYVALTRAKRELVIVTHPPVEAKDDRAAAYPGLLAATLADSPGDGLVWASGDPAWIETLPPAKLPAEPEAIQPAPSFAVKPDIRVVTPSGAKGEISTPAASESSPGIRGESRGKAFGTEVHRILEALERIAPGETPSEVRARLHAATGESAPDKALHAEALAHVMTALKSPDFRKAFVLPETATVRRETPFALPRPGGELLSGTFDRIVFDGDGAVIQDFKTDAIAPEALRERYEEPMRLYREALAALTGMPPEKIGAVLLHTPSGVAVQA